MFLHFFGADSENPLDLSIQELSPQNVCAKDQAPIAASIFSFFLISHPIDYLGEFSNYCYSLSIK